MTAPDRLFRSRCICPPPMTSEQTLHAVAGLGGSIGTAVARLLAERDGLGADLARAQAVTRAAEAYVKACLCNGGVPELAHTINEAFSKLAAAVAGGDGHPGGAGDE